MHLFGPLTIRRVTLRNRIAVSPMCQYSSSDGFASDWHLVHLGSRASGGAGLVITEAAAVSPEGRISPDDLGIWKDEHVAMLARINRFIHSQGAAAGIQLAHAGRKAGTWGPASGKRGPIPVAQSWRPVGASPMPFHDGYQAPIELDQQGISEVVAAFVSGAARALEADFDVIELHGAHGYLISSFLSPLSNRRQDNYGGSLANRCRLLEEIVDGVRSVWPEDRALFVRISASDWHSDGWTGDDTVALANRLAPRGVDLIDCSSGGNTATAPPNIAPGFQVPFAARVRRESSLLSGAVGLITDPAQADTVIRAGEADLVLLARQLLREPYWPVRAAHQLGHPQPLPTQYLRGKYLGSR